MHKSRRRSELPGKTHKKGYTDTCRVTETDSGMCEQEQYRNISTGMDTWKGMYIQRITREDMATNTGIKKM